MKRPATPGANTSVWLCIMSNGIVELDMMSDDDTVAARRGGCPYGLEARRGGGEAQSWREDAQQEGMCTVTTCKGSRRINYKHFCTAAAQRVWINNDQGLCTL